MDWMIQAAQLVLSLSILIVLHEMGHFIPARLFHTRVEKFYLFFDPWFSLFKYKKGDTEYGIGWLPLGGYVKISGMIDESMDKEQMKQPPQPWEFRSKPAWQRLIIMIGGVTVNVILAMVIYAGTIFYYGDKYLPNDNLKDGIWAASEIATNIGLQNGDKIISIDGEKPVKFSEISSQLLFGNELTVDRNGEMVSLSVPTNIIEQVVDENTRSPLVLPRIPFVIVDVPAESHNTSAGFKKGDKVIGINGESIQYADQFITYADNHKNSSVNLELENDGIRRQTTANINEDGHIGVIRGMPSFVELEKMGIYQLETTEYSLFEAIPAGISKAGDKINMMGKQLKMIASPETGAYKGLGGFASIGSLFGATWDWQLFWELTALLSVILAIMNILPIPALDGGHVVFLIYEIVTKRKPNEKVMEYAQIAGFLIVLALVLYANINDIIQFNR